MLSPIRKAGEKGMPLVVSHSTNQRIQPTTTNTERNFKLPECFVRWPGKTCGALVFALHFWFFWFKPKEHMNESTNEKTGELEFAKKILEDINQIASKCHGRSFLIHLINTHFSQ